MPRWSEMQKTRPTTNIVTRIDRIDYSPREIDPPEISNNVILRARATRAEERNETLAISRPARYSSSSRPRVLSNRAGKSFWYLSHRTGERKEGRKKEREREREREKAEERFLIACQPRARVSAGFLTNPRPTGRRRNTIPPFASATRDRKRSLQPIFVGIWKYHFTISGTNGSHS